MEPMETAASPRRFSWPLAAGAVVLGLLGAAAGVKVFLAPKRDLAVLRAESVKDVMTLYELQMAYKKRHGTFVDGAELLISKARDREGLRARLASHVDMATLTVVGDAEKFKIEANVLDAERTLLKIKGPIDGRRPERAVPRLAEHTRSGGLDAGAPIAPAR